MSLQTQLRTAGETVMVSGRGRPFSPGVSGNPGGRPRVPRDVRQALRIHTPEAIDTLVRVMRTASPSLALRAAEAILDRAWGRPPWPENHADCKPFAVMPADERLRCLTAIAERLQSQGDLGE